MSKEQRIQHREQGAERRRLHFSFIFRTEGSQSPRPSAVKPLAFMVLLAALSPAFAQENPLSGLFFSAGPHYYIAPQKPFEKPFPGIRLGGGWELPLGPGSLALGLETGWTYTGLTGDWRRADSTHLIPLSFRAGYGVPLRSFILRLDALAGGLVSVLGGNGETRFTPIAGVRLGAEYRLRVPLSPVAWSVFAGAGVDLLPENRRAAVLPAVEAGVKIRIKSSEERARLKAARLEAERLEAARQEEARLEAARQEVERLEAAQREAPRQEAAQQEAARQEAARQEAARLEAARQEVERLEAAQREASRQETAPQEAARQEADRLEAARLEAARQEVERLEAAQREAARQEAARQEAARQEAARQEEAWQEEAIRQGIARQEAERQEEARRELAPQEAAQRETAALRKLAAAVPDLTSVESRHIALLTIWLPGNVSAISAAERTKLAATAEFLRTIPDAQLIVADHAASTGNDEEECLIISRERAQAVAEILVQNGVEASRIEQRAFGNAFPLAPNSTAAGRARNRRVELILITGKAQ